MKLKIDFLKAILLMFFTVLTLQVQAQDISEELGDFNAIKTYHAVEVTFIPSQESRIVISGHSKNEVKYEIVEGVLEIKLTLDNLWSEDDTRIIIYGNVEGIIATQASTVVVEGELRRPEIVIRAEEGATILAEVSSEKIVVEAVSGGVVELTGSAESQEAEVNTAGSYKGSDLRTKRTAVVAGTAAKAAVFASEYCKATAKLGAVIKVLGNPDELETKTSLGGKIL